MKRSASAWSGSAEGKCSPVFSTRPILLTTLLSIALLSSVAAQCFDTDQGNNPYKAGLVATPHSILTDKCMAENKTIFEYYCDNNNLPQVNSYYCVKGCHDTYYYELNYFYYGISIPINDFLGQCRNTAGGSRFAHNTIISPVVSPPPAPQPIVPVPVPPRTCRGRR